LAQFGLPADVPRDCSSEDLPNNPFWLSQLPGGLPPKFDYCVVRSVAAALILTLLHCDRGRVAVGLLRHRHQIGADPVYGGMMVAWDHGHQELVDPDQVLRADSKLVLDEVDAALGHQTPLCDFDPDDAVFDRLIERWRTAARHFQRRKDQTELQRRLAHKVDFQATQQDQQKHDA
jgi:hypothetical protein